MAAPAPCQHGRGMRFDRELAALARCQYGVISRPQARAIGLSGTEVHRLCRSSQWETIGGRVLRASGSADTIDQRLMAAALDQGGDACLGFLTAASWWGLDGCPVQPITLVTSAPNGRTTELARVHRIRLLPDRWSVTLRGIPVVRPEMLAMQLFDVCRPGRAERLVDRLWAKRLLSGRSIELFLCDMGRSGRNGIGGLRAYLDERGADYEPPASGLESRVRQILLGAGIRLDGQVDSGGEHWTGRVDFRHPDLPFVLEVQSEAHHTALTNSRHDEARRAALEAAGFVYREVWDSTVLTRPDEVVTVVRDGIAEARTHVLL